MSSDPSSGEMNPCPFDLLKDLTFPVITGLRMALSEVDAIRKKYKILIKSEFKDFP